MHSLRNMVFNALLADPELIGYGIHQGSLFPNFAPDSPASNLMVFAVIRWGNQQPTPGADTTVRPVLMSLWVYNREKDFAVIDHILKRCRDIFSSLVAQVSDGAAILGFDFQESSEDLRDDNYDAVARSETYKIVASGS
jgi:hypothetical protein